MHRNSKRTVTKAQDQSLELWGASATCNANVPSITWPNWKNDRLSWKATLFQLHILMSAPEGQWVTCPQSYRKLPQLLPQMPPVISDIIIVNDVTTTSCLANCCSPQYLISVIGSRESDLPQEQVSSWSCRYWKATLHETKTKFLCRFQKCM